MKPEPKNKKLTLNKETLRDLTATARNAEQIKGGQAPPTLSLPYNTYCCPNGKTHHCATKKYWGC